MFPSQFKVRVDVEDHDEPRRTPAYSLDQDGASSDVHVTSPDVLVHADAHGHHGRGPEFEFRSSVADAAASWTFHLS